METQIEIWPTNPTPGQRGGQGEGLYDMHALPVSRGDEVVQPDPDPPRKARPALSCTECGEAAPELFIVRPDEELCAGCLTPEDLIRYPEQARKLFGGAR